MTLTEKDLDEIKAYYRDEALKLRNKQYRRFALEFLDMFDVYFAMRQPHFKNDKLETNSMFYNERCKFRRAESMIERYFKMKAKGTL
jgi:hypothetical protein